jgi:hypothetical protein
MDESAFLVGLLTAICRTSLWLAPAQLVRGQRFRAPGPGRGNEIRSRTSCKPLFRRLIRGADHLGTVFLTLVYRRVEITSEERALLGDGT